MKAPEKIYMPTELLSEDWTRHIEGQDIEYTRTDAFVEKACVNLKKLMYDNLMFQGRLHREKVIDNFVETFKDYMKGE